MIAVRKRLFISAVALLILAGYALHTYARTLWVPAYQNLAGKRSVQQVLEQYEAGSLERLRPYFDAAKAPYPPKRVALLAIKDEKKLELWTEEAGERFFIRSYPIKAASGVSGPKLREGDRQVPEGIYRLEHLNPNSAYHLSMKIDYPNSSDRQQAAQEGRTRLGGDIFIHGKAVSIGCLAMGDQAIEELFTLVARIGVHNVKVIIAPSDPRRGDIQHIAKHQPDWVAELYKNIAADMLLYNFMAANSGLTGRSSEGNGSLMKKCH